MDLQDNNLEGPIIPQFTGGLQNLSTVKLSNNSLKGAIPSWIFSWPSLSYLDLSHNHFFGQLKDFSLTGEIPSSICNLKSLKVLDLARTNLRKRFRNVWVTSRFWICNTIVFLVISKQLASLTSIAVLNLFLNHLERCIPKRPQFATFENNSYEGNDGLRGFLVSGGCGSNLIPKKNNKTFVPNEEGDSTFQSELCWEVVLIRYGCGLIIGSSIAYVMLSYQKNKLASRIAEELEYIISVRNRKKPRESHLMSCTNLNRDGDSYKNSCLTIFRSCAIIKHMPRSCQHQVSLSHVSCLHVSLWVVMNLVDFLRTFY
ncbi:hypothetical protein CQW23_28826 [Capsicum baccatum]|uniref:Uncharacterized protein n=1 Tax=Capsicum baccatum TaxID=33114 RepID=A0A2G2VHR6_CAPBA|nr:hypothetical protein CQW23_28826 [Capsicum baccatum]